MNYLSEFYDTNDNILDNICNHYLCHLYLIIKPMTILYLIIFSDVKRVAVEFSITFIMIDQNMFQIIDSLEFPSA